MNWFLGRAKTPDIPDPADPTQTIAGPDRFFLEQDGAAVTRDLNDPATDTLYYLLKETGGDNIVAKNAKLKAGPRAPGDTLEIAETEADGVIVADAQVIV